MKLGTFFSFLQVPPRWEQALYGPPYLHTGPLFNKWVHEKVAAVATDHPCVVLDIGAGPTPVLPGWSFRGPGRRVIGIDIDPLVLKNTSLDEAHVTDGRAIPVPDNSVDVAQSSWVLEHLKDPVEHFREVARILRPGGCFMFLTVNSWHPTVVLFRMAPPRLKEVIERVSGAKSPTGEDYPVFFRANSAGQVRRLAAASGLQVVELRYREQAPFYLRRCLPLWLPAAAYVYVAQHLPPLNPIATALFGCLRKPADSEKPKS